MNNSYIRPRSARTVPNMVYLATPRREGLYRSRLAVFDLHRPPGQGACNSIARPEARQPTKGDPYTPHTPLSPAGAAVLGSTQPTEQPRPCAVASSLPPPLQQPTHRSDALSPSASEAPRIAPAAVTIGTFRQFGNTVSQKQCMNYEIVKMSPHLIDVLNVRRPAPPASRGPRASVPGRTATPLRLNDAPRSGPCT